MENLHKQVLNISLHTTIDSDILMKKIM